VREDRTGKNEEEHQQDEAAPDPRTRTAAPETEFSLKPVEQLIQEKQFQQAG
jgi:hypothetical protein